MQWTADLDFVKPVNIALDDIDKGNNKPWLTCYDRLDLNMVDMAMEMEIINGLALTF